MPTDHGQARDRRTEERKQRRAQAHKEGQAPPTEGDGSETEAPGARERVGQTAKLAVAAAALGAVVGAAGAAAKRGTAGPEQAAPDSEPEPDAESEEEPEAETERESEANAEPERAPAESTADEPDGEDGSSNGTATAAERQGEAIDDTNRNTAEDGSDDQGAAEPVDVPSGDVARIVASAREQLRALQGADPERISSFERTSGGWLVRLDVVELRRVPDSTDVLGTYELELSDEGDLRRYRRVRRYYRAQADPEEAL